MKTFRTTLRILAPAALAALLGVAGGCKKASEDEQPAAKRIEPLSKAEIERGQTACTAYVARVCACAETNPDLARTCELAKASPGALQLNLDFLASEGLEIAEQQAVKVEARKIAAVCFAADSKLDIAICPRKTP